MITHAVFSSTRKSGSIFCFSTHANYSSIILCVIRLRL